MGITNELRSFLREQGSEIIGFADLRCLPPEVRNHFDSGIVIGLSYSRQAMLDNRNGNPAAYYAEYTAINARLPKLASVAADFLIGHGYKAMPCLPTMIVSNDDHRTVLPFKTVATLAGVGWIGKCAVLMNDTVGSAFRLIVVLTDAKLDYGTPIAESKCAEHCGVCGAVCPGGAPQGGLWRVGVDRDSFFNAKACREAARVRAKETLDIELTLCGLCISNCPITRKALSY